jgi:hypothetical protein
MRHPVGARGRAAAGDSARGLRLETWLPPSGAPTARPRTRRFVAGQELGLRAARFAVSRCGAEELSGAVWRVEAERQRGPKAVRLMGNQFEAQQPATTDSLSWGGAA